MQPLEMETLLVVGASSDAPPVSPTLSSSRRRRRSSSQQQRPSMASALFSSAAGACLENDRNERMHGGGAPSSATPASGLGLRRSFSFAMLVARGRIRTLLIAVGVLVVVAMLSNVLVSTEMSVLLDEVDDEGGDSHHGHHHAAVHAQSSVHPAHQPLPAGAPSASPISAVLGPTSQESSDPSSSSSSTTDWNQDGSGSGTDGTNDGGAHVPPPKLMDNATHIFMSRWCDVDPSHWFPSGSNAWQRRAPYVLLPGAKHSGVEEVARALQQLHPSQIVLARPESLGQFYPQRFRTVKRGDDKTHVALSRARMYARDYTSVQAAAAQAASAAAAATVGAAASANGTATLQPSATAPNLVGVDYTSGYMFYPPTRILCVMPWIKLVVVVRNPVDRVVAHYQEARGQRKYRGTLEAWLRDEWTALRDAGLLTNASSWKNNATALETAWYRYQLKPREGAIGRSLYEMQLRHWLEAMRVVGHDVAHDVMVVYAEDLLARPGPVLAQISNFLGLLSQNNASATIGDAPKSLAALVQPLQQDAASATILSNQTRNELEAFFKPFNRRWKQLIKTYKIRTSSSSSSAAKAKGDG
jgi:Sulfotransferase domain